jgi:hypothetical protein
VSEDAVLIGKNAVLTLKDDVLPDEDIVPGEKDSVLQLEERVFLCEGEELLRAIGPRR